MTPTERAARRAALDAYFARASGRPGNGLADYVQRLRTGHRAVIDDRGIYRGCACGELTCGDDLLFAWCDELIASYQAKVDEFAAETLRASSALAAKEAAEARAKALQGKIDRCVEHIRVGQQLRPDEPDPGLEALVVGWVNYHGDCCNFKARAERAEAQVRAVEALCDRTDREALPTGGDCEEHVSTDQVRIALAAVAPSEPQETTEPAAAIRELVAAARREQGAVDTDFDVSGWALLEILNTPHRPELRTLDDGTDAGGYIVPPFGLIADAVSDAILNTAPKEAEMVEKEIQIHAAWLGGEDVRIVAEYPDGCRTTFAQGAVLTLAYIAENHDRLHPDTAPKETE